MTPALIIYGVSSILFLIYMFYRNELLEVVTKSVFALAVIAHTVSVVNLGLSMNEIPVATMAQALNMTVLIASLIFAVLIFRKPTMSLGIFFVPAATFCLAIISSYTGDIKPFNGVSLLYYFHTMTSIAGEALFGVAFITSVVFLIHERIIRKGRIHEAGFSLPPLNLLERILVGTLSAGFIIITFGMLSGGYWAAFMGIRFSVIAPKVLAGAITWAVFALTIHQRFAMNWKGRRTAVITIIGFAVMILFLIGIDIIMPQTHGSGLLP